MWGKDVDIVSHDYWVKIVEMLQQNWALIDDLPDGQVRVYFISDASGVFDEMRSAARRDETAAYRLEMIVD